MGDSSTWENEEEVFRKSCLSRGRGIHQHGKIEMKLKKRALNRGWGIHQHGNTKRNVSEKVILAEGWFLMRGSFTQKKGSLW